MDGVIDLIGKKWTLCIVTTLGGSPRLRFNALLEALPGISPRTLSDTLQQLRREDLVRREVFAESPPRVQYSLTEGGEGLRESVRPLMEWAAARESAAITVGPTPAPKRRS